MFNECIARHIFQEDRATDDEETRIVEQMSFSLCLLHLLRKGVFILPPSSGLGEGIEGHRIASSFEVLRRI